MPGSTNDITRIIGEFFLSGPRKRRHSKNTRYHIDTVKTLSLHDTPTLPEPAAHRQFQLLRLCRLSISKDVFSNSTVESTHAQTHVKPTANRTSAINAIRNAATDTPAHLRHAFSWSITNMYAKTRAVWRPFSFACHHSGSRNLYRGHIPSKLHFSSYSSYVSDRTSTAARSLMPLPVILSGMSNPSVYFLL